jgi:murein DD-endopeptidase MepM/ murein hydrolase activator NlpD
MAKKFLSVANPVLKNGKHYISLDYGNTYSDGSFHKGIDLLASDITGKGADYILAFADGTVTACCNSMSGTTSNTGTKGMGNYVIIDHGNGFKTRYQHMLKGSVKVAVGNKVAKGQVIGYMGNTGNSSGRHLHFDISYNKSSLGGYLSNGRYYLDPKPYLQNTKRMSTDRSDKTEYVVNVKTALNVRKNASLSSAVVKCLYPGTKVYVYEVNNGWGRIGINQWVNMDYLVKKV